MERVVVIGASGFIGRATVYNLSRNKGLDVHAVYNKRRPLFDARTTIHKVNLYKYEEIDQLFSTIKPAYLVQLAWCTDQKTYWNSFTNFDWVSINMSIAKSFAKNGGQRCLFMGTSAEYDWSKDHPMEEFHTPLIPQKIYGASKLASYWLLTRFFEHESIPMVWGRLFNPFGPYEDPGRLIPRTCLRILKGDKVVFDQGLTLRDFLHVDDVGSAIAALLTSSINGPVNIGVGQATSIRAVIEHIAINYDRRDLVSFEATKDAPLVPELVIADTTRLNDEVGWKPKTSLQERLKETCQWWQEYGS